MSSTWMRQRVHRNDHLQLKVGKGLRNQYSDLFFESLLSTTGVDGKSGNKLRTYRLIKQHYAVEPYLTKKVSFCVARGITKLRVSAHDLAIETGRRRRPPVPANERYCTFCPGQIEDEIHFVTQCTYYRCERQKLYNVCNIQPTGHNEKEIFCTLMCSDQKHVLNSLGNFILAAFKKRNSV